MKFETIAERLHSTDRAVSPVIGVILMVAITVILAAVIGTFVLDLGQSAGQSAPSASLSVTVDASSDNMTISHKGGDSLVAANTRLLIANKTGDSQPVTFEAGGTDPDNFGVGQTVDVWTNDAFGSGNSTITSSTWSSYDDVTTTIDIKSGMTYTVTIIDLDSQRVVYETDVTA